MPRFQVQFSPSACGHPGWQLVDTVQRELMPRVHSYESDAQRRASMLNAEVNRHESVRLFQPTPPVMPGQTGFAV